MVLRTLFLAALLIAQVAQADEKDLGKKASYGYSESLCIAGVAAENAKYAHNASELKACADKVKDKKRTMNRVAFAVELCEANFRSHPVQRKACYMSAMQLNGPSQAMASISFACAQQKDDVMYSACARLQFANLDEALRNGNYPPKRFYRNQARRD